MTTLLARSGTRTTCPYCGVGCGVIASPGADGVRIVGDPEHPANRGQLCVKGSALGETLGLEGRLLRPELRDAAGALQPGSWDTALDRIASVFARTVREHGPDSVAMYVSGQLLTEDYYVANKFVKGYLGTANIDTNSRLCMASSVAGHRRAFGEDVVPVRYDDVEAAELVVLVGSNLAWCHPVLHRRLVAARARPGGPRVIVLDPRRTATCEDADLHLPLKPGSDVALFSGLLVHLASAGCVNEDFVRDHTNGFDDALAAARECAGNLEQVAIDCGLDVDALAAFYAEFACSERVVTLFSQGVNQSSSGTDKVNAIIDVHLATGRIGMPGAGPFSITGQPNAMGGREVGGLANQLAAHFELERADDRAHVRAFWGSPTIADRAGLKAVDLFDAVADGRVKALWIMGTNPLVSLPDASRVRRALERCPFVVVSEVVRDAAPCAHAHVLLPALAWGEKDGTVTNSERCVSRQRAFLPPPGEARPDWWAIAQVARRMGHEHAFAYTAPHEVFREHARLSTHAQVERPRAFELSAFTEVHPAAYDGLAPTYWPTRSAAATVFANARFSHADGRARFVALRPRAPGAVPDEAFPFVLNTGRLRDQWHTMSRTGRAPTLSAHRAEPELELHPIDARTLGVGAGDIVRVTSRHGEARLFARVVEDVVPGQVFAPIHWHDGVAADAGVGRVVNAFVDPVSGEPEFKHTPVRVERVPVGGHGFVLLSTHADGAANVVLRHLHGTAFGGWVRIRVRGGELLRVYRTGDGGIEAWDALAAHLGASLAAHCGAPLELRDAAGGVLRMLWHTRGEGAPLVAALFAAPTRAELPDPTWLARVLVGEVVVRDRLELSNGGPLGVATRAGAVVCACHGVDAVRIEHAIQHHGDRTIDALGARLRCGTNCGSCVPELRRLLRLHPEPAVAEVEEALQ